MYLSKAPATTVIVSSEGIRRDSDGVGKPLSPSPSANTLATLEGNEESLKPSESANTLSTRSDGGTSIVGFKATVSRFVHAPLTPVGRVKRFLGNCMRRVSSDTALIKRGHFKVKVSEEMIGEDPSLRGKKSFEVKVLEKRDRTARMNVLSKPQLVLQDCKPRIDRVLSKALGQNVGALEGFLRSLGEPDNAPLFNARPGSTGFEDALRKSMDDFMETHIVSGVEKQALSQFLRNQIEDVRSAARGLSMGKSEIESAIRQSETVIKRVEESNLSELKGEDLEELIDAIEEATSRVERCEHCLSGGLVKAIINDASGGEIAQKLGPVKIDLKEVSEKVWSLMSADH